MTEKQRSEILRQVERGELSVDDALKLLEEADRIMRSEERADHLAEVKNAVSDVLYEVSESLKGAGEVVNDVFTDVGKELRENQDIRSALTGLFSGLYTLGSGHSYTYAHEGSFEAELVRIVLHGRNGRLHVRNWEGAGYKLATKVTVRAASEAEANAMSRQAYTLKATPSELSMEVSPALRNVGVNAELFLPHQGRYSLILETSNGSVQVDDITGDELEINTSNGAVALNGCCFDRASVDTSNGSVELTGSCGEAKVDTSNGSIRVDAAAPWNSLLDLSTSNGSISLVVDDDPDTGYAIEASTSNGRVTADVQGLSIKAVGKNKLSAHSEGYDQCSKHIRIYARTSNGRISVGHR